MSELRQDIVSGDWVILAPGRAARPHFLDDKRKPRKPSPKSTCPFEDLEKSGNWPPIFMYPERELPSGKKWEIVVLPNKYPALQRSNVCAVPLEHSIYEGKTGIGTHNLLLTRDHNKNFADIPFAQAVRVFEVLQACHAMMAQDRCAEYVSSFFNWGPAAGASVWHPHYQMLGLPIVPSHVAQSLRGASEYFERTGRCVRCDVIKAERKEGIRVIEENDRAIAVTPYAAKKPFEMNILPKRHETTFRESSQETLRDMAALLRSVMKRLRKYANDPDLNMFIHDAPLKKQKYDHHHWHIEVVPKLATPAGFELSTGIDINPTDPDMAAHILRGGRV